MDLKITEYTVCTAHSAKLKVMISAKKFREQVV
jgi:hypothetical protein